MQLIKCISNHPQESRKEWLLWMMARAGKKNNNNTRYQFWKQNNMPIELEGAWLNQKLEYIHNNPWKLVGLMKHRSTFIPVQEIMAV